jgi:hypothetical protein
MKEDHGGRGEIAKKLYKKSTRKKRNENNSKKREGKGKERAKSGKAVYVPC